MVTQKMLRTYKENWPFLFFFFFRFATALDLNKCLNQIKYTDFTTPISDLPSNISTMLRQKKR